MMQALLLDSPMAMMEREPTPPNAVITPEVTLLRKENAQLKSQLKRLEKEVYHQKQTGLTDEHSLDGNGDVLQSDTPANLSRRQEKKKADEDFKEKVVMALDGVVRVHAKRWSTPRIASCLVLALWIYVGGICQSFIVLIGKQWLRENVFTPWAILREMDLAGGTLSYEGLELLRRVETSGKKFVKNCVIPSSAELKRCAKKVEQFARELCPFSVTSNDEYGESISFHFAKMVATIMKAFGLYELG